MLTMSKEVIKEMVREHKFSNTTEVMDCIKEMFKDVIQEIMEAELEAELGYEKQERSENVGDTMSKNTVMDIRRKRSKPSLGK